MIPHESRAMQHTFGARFDPNCIGKARPRLIGIIHQPRRRFRRRNFMFMGELSMYRHCMTDGTSTQKAFTWDAEGEEDAAPDEEPILATPATPAINMS